MILCVRSVTSYGTKVNEQPHIPLLLYHAHFQWMSIHCLQQTLEGFPPTLLGILHNQCSHPYPCICHCYYRPCPCHHHHHPPIAISHYHQWQNSWSHFTYIQCCNYESSSPPINGILPTVTGEQVMPKNIIQKDARSIEAIAPQFREQFPLNSRWGSFEVLRDRVKVAAKAMDFTVTSSGLKLSCNRCGLPHSN